MLHRVQKSETHSFPMLKGKTKNRSYSSWNENALTSMETESSSTCATFLPAQFN